METQNMAQDPLFIIVILAMAAVAIILMIGIGGFGRGGMFINVYSPFLTGRIPLQMR